LLPSLGRQGICKPVPLFYIIAKERTVHTDISSDIENAFTSSCSKESPWLVKATSEPDGLFRMWWCLEESVAYMIHSVALRSYFLYCVSPIYCSSSPTSASLSSLCEVEYCLTTSSAPSHPDKFLARLRCMLTTIYHMATLPICVAQLGATIMPSVLATGVPSNENCFSISERNLSQQVVGSCETRLMIAEPNVQNWFVRPISNAQSRIELFIVLDGVETKHPLSSRPDQAA